MRGSLLLHAIWRARPDHARAPVSRMRPCPTSGLELEQIEEELGRGACEDSAGRAARSALLGKAIDAVLRLGLLARDHVVRGTSLRRAPDRVNAYGRRRFTTTSAGSPSGRGKRPRPGRARSRTFCTLTCFACWAAMRPKPPTRSSVRRSRHLRLGSRSSASSRRQLALREPESLESSAKLPGRKVS